MGKTEIAPRFNRDKGNRIMLGLKNLNSFRKTAYGILAGMVLWVFTVGIMLTNPGLEARKPGVFEAVPLFIPDLDPETGRPVFKPRYLPV